MHIFLKKNWQLDCFKFYKLRNFIPYYHTLYTVLHCTAHCVHFPNKDTVPQRLNDVNMCTMVLVTECEKLNIS